MVAAARPKPGPYRLNTCGNQGLPCFSSDPQGKKTGPPVEHRRPGSGCGERYKRSFAKLAKALRSPLDKVMCANSGSPLALAIR